MAKHDFWKVERYQERPSENSLQRVLIHSKISRHSSKRYQKDFGDILELSFSLNLDFPEDYMNAYLVIIGLNKSYNPQFCAPQTKIDYEKVKRQITESIKRLNEMNEFENLPGKEFSALRYKSQHNMVELVYSMQENNYILLKALGTNAKKLAGEILPYQNLKRAIPEVNKIAQREAIRRQTLEGICIREIDLRQHKSIEEAISSRKIIF